MIPLHKDWLDIAQILAICATLGVLLWYTIETYRLRKETQKQTENSIKPCIVGSFKEGSYFILMNVGTGPALNIHVAGKANTGEKLNPIFIEFINCGEHRQPIFQSSDKSIDVYIGTTIECLYMSLSGSRYYSKIGITFGATLFDNESFLLEYRQINLSKELRMQNRMKDE